MFLRGPGRQNLWIIAVYICAMLLSAYCERNSTIITGYLDIWLVPYGISTSVICTKSDGVVDAVTTLLKSIWMYVFRYVLKIRFRIFAATKAFIKQLVAPE